jgi:hypothetical protein
VALYVYRRIDTIVGSFEKTVFTLEKTIPLSFIGGSKVIVFLAANQGHLVIGTNNSAMIVVVNKRTYVITPLTVFSETNTSITADNYGYVTVSSANGNFEIGPDGALLGDGGGSQFMINDLLGTRP